MAWWYLIIAGMLEWGWPMGLKFAWREGSFYLWPALFAILTMAGSGYFLFLAQREIPVGTAYAVWTGIGAAGTFILGIVLLGEAATLARFFFVGLIIIGIAGLKFS